MTRIDPKERLIIALDCPLVQAQGIVSDLGDDGRFYKIGYQLAYAGGFGFAEKLIAQGKKVFLDLKLHDIGNTVGKGVEAVARMGATFLTVHAYPQTMQAAVEARAQSGLKILAVTVLTSYDDADLKESGYAHDVAALVARRAGQAKAIGVDGLVCSAEEAPAVRGLVGPGMALITPGIRPSGADAGDQKRVMTPGDAIRAGADYLVVGRPVVAAQSPAQVARAIVNEIEQAAGQGANG